MASDLISNLRVELEAQLAFLEPQIRGLHDLASSGVSISDALRTEIQGEITDRERRKNLIQNVLDALSALEADGYPELPQNSVTQSLYSELQEEIMDLQAAAAVFSSEAAVMKVTLGPFTDKE